MDPGLSKTFNQVRTMVSGLSARQRLTLAGGSVLAVLVLVGFVRYAGGPEYKALYTNLPAGEAESIAQRLSARKIAYEISPDQSGVRVAADQVDRARMELAAEGVPRSGRLGFELFDKVNWTGTEFSDRVNYQRAMEGELERTIGTLAEVKAVRVHLVLPRESLFTEREREAKAAVVVKLASRLPQTSTAAIQQLVASAIDNLAPEHVTVVDADNQGHLSGRDQDSGGTAESALEHTLSARLLATVEPVIGAGHVRASVRVEYDPSSAEETSETYDPQSAVALAMHRTEERMLGTNANGIAGTASNLPNTGSIAAMSAPAAEGTTSRSENGSYGVNKTIRHLVQPAGRLKRLAAAIVIDDARDSKQQDGKTVTQARARTAEELKRIEALAKAAIGFDEKRGDTLAVENMSFQDVATDQPALPSLAERVVTTTSRWSSLLRYAGLAMLFVVIYLIFLRPVKKQFVTALRELPAAVRRQSLAPAAGGAMLADAPMEDLPPEQEQVQRALALKQQLVERVKKEPSSASRLVQGWLRQGEARR